MTAEFWGGLAGAVVLTIVVNVVTVAYFYGRTVERIDGMQTLHTSEVTAVKERVSRVEDFIDNRRAVAARGGS